MTSTSGTPYDPAASPARRIAMLFVGDHFAYGDGVSHGLTTWCLTTLPVLAARGVDVTACFFRSSTDGAARLASLGIETLEFGCRPSSPMPFSRLWELTGRRTFDIIHTAQMKASLVARCVARGRGLPVVCHLHDDSMPVWPLRWINRKVGNQGEVGVCVSGALRECARAGYGFPASRQTVLYSGIDLDRLQRPRRDRIALRGDLLGVDERVPVIGMVGRFFAVKGHRALVEMLPRMLARHPEAIMVFVGAGPERAACEARVQALGLGGRVLFLGQRSDIAELMNCFDLLLMPSQSEGLPLTAVEALAAGTPVVGYDVGGMAEVITHQLTGIVVPDQDPEAFMGAVNTLLDDPGLRAAMAAAAPHQAAKFSIEGHASELIGLYRSLLSGLRAGR